MKLTREQSQEGARSGTLEQYFSREDTPSRNSPIARLIRQLDAIYPEMSAHELRGAANRRIHTGGPGRVKWSRAESKALKEARVLPDSNAGERLLSAGKVI